MKKLLLFLVLCALFFVPSVSSAFEVGGPGVGAAPAGAKYVVTEAHATLTDEIVATAAGKAVVTAASYDDILTLLSLDANLKDLTASEIGQLENIGDITLSLAQWTGLGGATTAGMALWDDADAAAQRTTMSAQTLDADLTLLAGADTWMLYYKNGSAVLTGLALSVANRVLMSTGASSAPVFTALTEAHITFSDVTTGDADTSGHGYRKKLTNVAYSYMDEQGTIRAATTVPSAPGSDKLIFWDHSATAFAYPTIVGGSLSGTVFTISTKDVDENIWQAVYVAAAGFECDGTNCADAAAAQINSGPNQYYTACSDAAGTIEFSIGMPENWDGGSIIIEPVMSSVEASPAGTIEWELSIQKCASDEIIDNTWVTTNGSVFFEDGETANTTVDTQYDLFKCKNKTAMAAGGAGGDQLFVKLTRDNDDATHDTSTQTINVLGVKVYYQIDDLDEKD